MVQALLHLFSKASGEPVAQLPSVGVHWQLPIFKATSWWLFLSRAHVYSTLCPSQHRPCLSSPLCGIASELSGSKIEELHFVPRKQCLWARVHPEALAWGKLKFSQIKYLSMVTQKILDPNPLTPETIPPFAFDRDDVTCFPVPPSEHTSSECALLWLNLLRLLTGPWNACSASWC